MVTLFEDEKKIWTERQCLKTKQNFTYVLRKENNKHEVKKVEQLHALVKTCFKYFLAVIKEDLCNEYTEDQKAKMRKYPEDINKVVNSHNLVDEAESLTDATVEKLLEPGSKATNACQVDIALLIKGLRKVWETVEKAIKRKQNANSAAADQCKWLIGEADLLKHKSIICERLFHSIEEFVCNKTEKGKTLTFLNFYENYISELTDKAKSQTDSLVIDLHLFTTAARILRRCVQKLSENVRTIDAMYDRETEVLEETACRKEEPTAHSLPYLRAPVVKSHSSFRRKTMIAPNQWNPEVSTLDEHIRIYLLRYLFTEGVTDNNEKVKAIYHIFSNEQDRLEFVDNILNNLNDSEQMSDRELSAIIAKICITFDRENCHSAESYRLKLESTEKCRQKPKERPRNYMARLQEWFKHAYPSSYDNEEQKKSLCRKFYNGLRDRDVARAVVETDKGFLAAFEDGTPRTLLKMIEDQTFRQSILDMREEDIEQASSKSKKVREIKNRSYRSKFDTIDDTEDYKEHVDSSYRNFVRAITEKKNESDVDSDDAIERADNRNRTWMPPRQMESRKDTTDFSHSRDQRHKSTRDHERQGDRQNWRDVDRSTNYRERNSGYRQQERQPRQRPTLDRTGKSEVTFDKFRELLAAELQRRTKDRNVDSSGGIIVPLSEIPERNRSNPNFNLRDWVGSVRNYTELRNEAYQHIKSKYYYEPRRARQQEPSDRDGSDDRHVHFNGRDQPPRQRGYGQRGRQTSKPRPKNTKYRNKMRNTKEDW